MILTETKQTKKKKKKKSLTTRRCWQTSFLNKVILYESGNTDWGNEFHKWEVEEINDSLCCDMRSPDNFTQKL